MAQTTALQLINEVEERLSWRQSETIEGDIRSDTRKMVRLLNRILRVIQTLQAWPTLIGESDIVTVAAYDTGTVDVTNNSDSVTGTGTSWDESFKGRAFQVSGDEYVYRITEVVSPTEITIHRAYLGETALLASYCIAQNRYTLPEDFDAPLEDWDAFFAPYALKFVGDQRLAQRMRHRGSGIFLSEPECYTIEGLDDQNVSRVVRLDPYPEFQRMYTFRYRKNHPLVENDDDRILYPPRVEDAIIQTMIDFGYRDFEDDDRMMRSLQDAIRAQNNVVSTREITQEPLRVTISNARRLREARRFGGGGRRVDYGAYFDLVGFTDLP